MTESQQRGIAQELHDHPINWNRYIHKPIQPDRIECGTRRYYPLCYELIAQGLSFAALAAILILGFIVLSLW